MSLWFEGASVGAIPTKGQLISKQNCWAITSPKKQMDEFALFFYPDDSEKYLKLEIKIKISSISESG